MAMDPISIGLGAISGLTSLGGLLGGEAARRRAEQARQQALTDLSGQLDQEYDQTVSNNRMNLMAATGQGGDAIQSLGRNLGSAMAGAGVYNSSATAGALQQAQGATQANLSGLASQNFQNEQGLLNANRRYLTSQRMGLANQQYGEAQNNLMGARSGLSSLLGSMGQFNLARSGGNQVQAGLTRSAGGYGNSSVLDPGAGLGGPGGSFNPNAFSPFGQMTSNFLMGKKAGPQFTMNGFNPNGY